MYWRRQKGKSALSDLYVLVFTRERAREGISWTDASPGVTALHTALAGGSASSACLRSARRVARPRPHGPSIGGARCKMAGLGSGLGRRRVGSAAAAAAGAECIV